MNLNELYTNNINNALSEKNSLLRYAVVIEYVGTSFLGSQIQPQGRTVQGEIESVLKILFSQEIRITMAGRTDSGVHARAQVAHFEVESGIDCKKLINSMNALLPPDISIANIVAVDKEFHSQKSAKIKHYRYAINNASQRSVWKEKNWTKYILPIFALFGIIDTIISINEISANPIYLVVDILSDIIFIAATVYVLMAPKKIN